MQAIRNGLKSAVRTPGKTLLFVLILTMTAALLTVSCCVFTAVRDYLDECGDYFHVIAVLEYIGKSYPDTVVYDEELAAAVEENRDALSELANSEEVLFWEPASAQLALSPLLQRKDAEVPRPDAAVLRICFHSYDESKSVYTALVEESLYSRTDYTNKLILVPPLDGPDQPQLRCSYLAAGEFFVGRSAFANFRIETLDRAEDGDEVSFQRRAEMLHRVNDSCPVTRTSAAEDLYPFHEQILKLTAGRFFTQKEYDEKARVCIVSERVTGLLGLKVGDSIPFTLLNAEGDLYGAEEHVQTGEESYEIVGITNHDENYALRVFLPDAEAACTAVRPVNGYALGQFRLKNDAVSVFLEQAAPLLEDGFRLNVYDQGYAEVREPMEELLMISAIFLAVCLLLAACALGLHSHIFVSRQKETGRTMLALGSGRPHVCCYFLSMALAVTIPGALLGALIGRLAEDRVFAILRRFIAQFAEQDLRFSSTRISVVRTLEFAPGIPIRTYLAAGAILMAGTLVFTLLFVLAGLQEKNAVKKKTVRRQAPGRCASVSRFSGFFKYGILSLRRGKARTAAVLLLGLAAAMFFGWLTASLAGYEEQMAAYRANAVISAGTTDFYGKQVDGLVVDGGAVTNLAVTDLATDCCATVSYGNIKFLGVEGGEQIPFDWPEYGTFAYENVMAQLIHEPAWIGTSSIAGSPPFRYSGSGSVEWLEGWSEADLTRLEQVYYSPDTQYSYWSGPAVCAVPRDMMEKYGIRLGDTINTVIKYWHPRLEYIMQPLQLQVVAAFVSPTGSACVYSPVTFIFREWQFKNVFAAPGSDPQLDACQALGLSPRLKYSSFTFTLKDAARLDELREAMEEADFTWVRSGVRDRSLAFIEDSVYLNTTRSMERQIQFVSALYNALYLLAGIIGFSLAWLLIRSRQREIAVMRALGTQSGRIVGNFLIEQFLLMATGLGLGIGISSLTGASLNQAQLLLTAAFLGLWTLSSLICLISGLKKQSFAALTEPE